MARANSLLTRASFPMPRACRLRRQAQQQKGAGGEEEEGTGGQGEDGAGGDKGGYDWLGSVVGWRLGLGPIGGPQSPRPR